MSVRVKSFAGGYLLPVHVQPRASKDRIVGEHGGALKVAVSAPPEGGRANEAVANLLAEALSIAPSRVTLSSGARSRAKVYLVCVSDRNALLPLCKAAPSVQIEISS